MKKLCAAVFCFVIFTVLVAVWYSPFAAFGGVDVYDNNERVSTVTGVCYGADSAVRVEIAGGENEVAYALDKLSATPVFTASAGDRTVVYAYSPRVSCKPFTAANGREYNVMAAYGDGVVVIGAPVLQGSY